MSTPQRLQNLAQLLRSLLGCESASLLLGCSEPALAHPLLAACGMGSDYLLTSHGTPLLPILYRDERLCALYDLVMQVGVMRIVEPDELAALGSVLGSLAIVPLERPAGMLGLFLLFDSRPAIFRQGERLLLEQYMPTAARSIEELLSDANASPMLKRLTERAEQEQYLLISMVSHELRMPLTAIKGYAGLLQIYGQSSEQENVWGEKGGLDEAQQQHYLSEIITQVNHLEVLVGDLLDISRLQAGRLSLSCTRMNIGQLCQQIARLYQQRLNAQQCGHYQIVTEGTDEAILAWADPDRVRQIVSNLLENAIKYSPEGGCIEILVQMSSTRARTLIKEVYVPQLAERKMITVTIRDQGIGIPFSQQSALFQPFTRLVHPATSQSSGFGLGLYISRKLVEAMNGSIILQSKEGQGTSVSISLPVASEQTSHLKGSIYEQIASDNSSGT